MKDQIETTRLQEIQGAVVETITLPIQIKAEIKMEEQLDINEEIENESEPTDGDRWITAAIERAGVDESEREGIWVGGLACPFGDVYEPIGGSWVENVDKDAFDETLRMAADPDEDWHISFCLDHACFVNSGLLGNTATSGEMSAYFWVEKSKTNIGNPGLYALARIGEYDNSPGQSAAEAIQRDGVQGMSIGFYILKEEYDFENEEYEPKTFITIKEIKLVEASGVDHAAYRNTFLRSGRYYTNMDKEKKDADKMATMKERVATRGDIQIRGCSCGAALKEDAGEERVDFSEELAQVSKEIADANETLNKLLERDEKNIIITDQEEPLTTERKTFTPFPI